MGVVTRDEEQTVAQLQRWLGEVAGLDGVTVDRLEIPASTGFSNETILFDATWTDDGGTPGVHHLVARIAPQAYTVFLEANFETQFRVMEALAEHTDVPVPRMLWFEPDPSWFGSPFWIMARVEGIAPADAPHYSIEGWLRDASPEQQATVWWNGIAALAAVHGLDWRALGLDRLDDPARGEPALEQQLTYYAESLAWAEQGTPHPGARAALEWLQANPPASDSEAVTITWGDARLANQMFRDGEVVAVLDWEMVALGDPRIDLGWWLFCDEVLTRSAGQERLPGFPSQEETVARWEELTGRDGSELHWFLVFAGLRFTVVMLRLGSLLHEMGVVPEPFGYDNDICRALDELVRERA
ncbi:MAG TPA: phosphotransferase family protein [Acidimicrobiia bacterium]|nr:phosphotransferase family protein [Acidimicrobiia bacterium]